MRVLFFSDNDQYHFFRERNNILASHGDSLYRLVSSDKLTQLLMEFETDEEYSEDFLVTTDEHYSLLEVKLAGGDDLDLSAKSKSEERILTILKKAIAQRSSDIHFIRDSYTSKVKFRVNGKMQFQQELLATDCDEMLFVLYNVMASTKETTWNTKSPQDANIILEVNKDEYRFRYAHMPIFSSGVGGASYHAVVRVIYPNQKDSVCRELNELGLNSTDQHLVENMLSNPSGLVVVSGVTGSGKSTSLKNFMEYLYYSKYNEQGCFLTVEDPVEYVIAGSQQSSVVKSNDSTNLFAEAVRSAMRRDPDVLMIGEIRDTKTGQALSSAVESGHLCLTTVHAGNVVGVLQRIHGLGISIDKLATPGFIAGIMNQKLVTTVCPHCSEDAVNDYGRAVKRQGKGCVSCKQQGVTGRKLVVEYLVPDLHVLKLTSEHRWVDIYSYIKSNRSHSEMGQGYSIKDKVYALTLNGLVCDQYFKSSFGHMESDDEELIFSVFKSQRETGAL
ncbi:ATPase, T2SS/T4P/T4SS family [Enterovibrio coralii]|uniref:Pilus assembly protein n=1 Tax=Enterovibrio coralii TaxID=294935 RepID=A0A135I5R4_9GAMM|nr:ATPase, T2SS/T4P/T4SS family [Enterovibrio coralii]KXF80796.1 pilus assembly protein [Enterovibrio coralii]